MLPATKRGLSGISAREVVGGAAGKLGGRLVDLEDVFLKCELSQADRRSVKGTGFDDVGTGLEVGAVNVLDHPGLRQHHDLGAVFQRDRVVRKRLPR